jgi:hypothetical protein
LTYLLDGYGAHLRGSDFVFEGCQSKGRNPVALLA